MSPLVTIPVLMHAWGLHGYGIWMTITAAPAYLGVLDLGLGEAVAVEMNARVSSGNPHGALRLFQGAWLFTTGMTLVTACALVMIWLEQGRVMPLIPITFQSPATIDAFVIMSVYLLLDFHIDLIGSAYQSTGRVSLGIMLRDLAVPVEVATLVSTVSCGFSLPAVALSLLATKTAFAVSYYAYLIRCEPWFRGGAQLASVGEIVSLVKPASGSLGFYLASTLNSNGLISSLGLFVSPEAAGLFGIARRLCRYPLQFVGVTGRVLIPAMTTAHAQGAHGTFLRLIKYNLAVTAVLSVPYAVLLSLEGPRLMSSVFNISIASGGAIFVALSASAAFEPLWTNLSQALFATNRQHLISSAYLAGCCCLVVVPYVSNSTYAVELCAVGASVVDAAMCIIVARIAVRQFWSGHTEIGLPESIGGQMHGSQP